MPIFYLHIILITFSFVGGTLKCYVQPKTENTGSNPVDVVRLSTASSIGATEVDCMGGFCSVVRTLENISMLFYISV